ncbi:MAG TPA: DUF2914 domain-containing protein [Polyangiaceae bacterium]|jgi:hypothetical protein
MFSIGFSITGVACSVRGTTAAEARQNDERIPTVPSAIAPAASAPAASVVQNAPAPSAASSATTGSLHVRRLVVTRKIENHEPVEDKEITLGGAPIYAFVELENEGPSARAVRILFENEHSQATVGHVKLNVPGGQLRFRTWGNTRMIAEPGRWIAIVSTSDGTELARAPFDVKG